MTVKELRKLLKSYDDEGLVLMNAGMRGFDEVKGVTGLNVVLNKRADANGEGDYVDADDADAGKRKRRHFLGFVLHADDAGRT